ncbi:MAG TPA: iron-sulfur cluster carrier protein MrpORP [Spirochaetota bacterium]|nr:iron-sulfur cluster carrier protein MrpORP [Spirochaetota bacterium]
MEKAKETGVDKIKNKIAVMSGKGGVGKSTVAVNLANALAESGYSVGLLDVDIHGPSVPAMLGLEDGELTAVDNKMVPVERGNLKVLSIAFLLKNPDDAVIWRGPRKMGVIKQFLEETIWGELDYLIIDLPPGTGDEPLSICQLIKDLFGAVIVSTPQKVALLDVRKAVSFCHTLKLRVLGLVENMSGFTCPRCGLVTNIFPAGQCRKAAAAMGVPFLGAIPMDPDLAAAGDNGSSFLKEFPQKDYMQNITAAVTAGNDKELHHNHKKNKDQEEKKSNLTKEKNMRIAIPLTDGKLALHFGHCEQFALIEANEQTREITDEKIITAPAHQPGLLPGWLAEKNIEVVITGGMGQRAVNMFTQNNIKVITGAPAGSPREIVTAYLQDKLQTEDNRCDH